MRSCCIDMCENSSMNEKQLSIKGITMFRFVQEDEGKQEWFRIINSVKGQYLRRNKKIHFICQKHFDKSVLKQNEKKLTLRKNAVPTIFPSLDNNKDPLNIDGHSTIIYVDNIETDIPSPKYSPKNISQTIPQKFLQIIPQKSSQCVQQKTSTSIPLISSQSIPYQSPQSIPQTSAQSIPQKSSQSISQKGLQCTPQRNSPSISQCSTKSIPQCSTQSIAQSSIKSIPQSNLKGILKYDSQGVLKFNSLSVTTCRYPGDIDINMVCKNPKTSYDALVNYRNSLNSERNKVRLLRQNKHRHEEKLKAYRAKIEDLENKMSVSKNAISHILEVNNWTPSDLIKELRAGLHGDYKEELRAFVTRILMSFI